MLAAGSRRRLAQIVLGCMLALSGWLFAMPAWPLHARGADPCPEPNDRFRQACLLPPDSDAVGYLFHPNDFDAFSPGTYYVFADSSTGEFSDGVPYRLSSTLAYPGSSPTLLFGQAFARRRAGSNGGNSSTSATRPAPSWPSRRVPPNVERLCGSTPVPWESLCNVHPDLHAAFLRIEQLPFDYQRDRISAMVRDRHVTVEWEPFDSGATHLGRFNLREATVWIPQRITREPTRVKGAIVAHELWHAATEVYQLLGPKSQWDPVEYCLEDESGAFINGLAAFSFFADQDGWPRPRTALDAYLMGLALDPSHSDTLAEQHLEEDGYHERCGALHSSSRSED